MYQYQSPDQASESYAELVRGREQSRLARRLLIRARRRSEAPATSNAGLATLRISVPGLDGTGLR